MFIEFILTYRFASRVSNNFEHFFSNFYDVKRHFLYELFFYVRIEIRATVDNLTRYFKVKKNDWKSMISANFSIISMEMKSVEVKVSVLLMSHCVDCGERDNEYTNERPMNENER